MMDDYEDRLDEIRVKLFEETNGMEKQEIINIPRRKQRGMLFLLRKMYLGFNTF